MLARKPSVSSACLVLLSRTVSFRPVAGVPVNAPHRGNQILSIWLVAISSRLMPSGVSASQAGASVGWLFRPRNCILKFKSATTLLVSNCTPQAFNNLSSEEEPPPMLPIIGFC